MTEITRLEEGTLLVEEQREGPFRSWVHTRWFEAVPQGGTRLTEPIEYEPPTGMLGLMLTSALVDRELGWAYVYRAEALAKLLTSGAQGT